MNKTIFEWPSQKTNFYFSMTFTKGTILTSEYIYAEGRSNLRSFKNFSLSFSISIQSDSETPDDSEVFSEFSDDPEPSVVSESSDFSVSLVSDAPGDKVLVFLAMNSLTHFAPLLSPKVPN